MIFCHAFSPTLLYYFGENDQELFFTVLTIPSISYALDFNFTEISPSFKGVFAASNIIMIKLLQFKHNS